MKENIIIAEFMELPKVPCNIGTENGIFTEGYKHPKVDVPVIHSGMQYKDSWDWIMPVVKKCYESDTNIEVGDITHGLLDCDLESTHQAVVEFIKTKNTMILKYEVQWDSDGDLTHIRYAQDFETIEEARIALALHHKRNAVLTVKQIRE